MKVELDLNHCTTTEELNKAFIVLHEIIMKRHESMDDAQKELELMVLDYYNLGRKFGIRDFIVLLMVEIKSHAGYNKDVLDFLVSFKKSLPHGEI